MVYEVHTSQAVMQAIQEPALYVVPDGQLLRQPALYRIGAVVLQAEQPEASQV